MTLYNIFPLLVKNSGQSGFQVLTESQLNKFIDGNTSSDGVGVSTAISIDIDLFKRYKVSEIRYYYSGQSEFSVYISMEGTDWYQTTYEIEDGYICIDSFFDSFDFTLWPRYVRINHSKVSDSVYGYEIVVLSRYSDSIKYGVDGSDTYIDTDISEIAEVTELPVYNNSLLTRNFSCFIDESDDNLGKGVGISTTSSGYFYTLHEKGLRFPRDYSWETGLFIGTEVVSNTVRTVTSSGTGYYYSPIFDIESMPSIRLYVESTTTSGSYLDWNDVQVDSSNTIGVRFSNTQPIGTWSNGQLPQNDDENWKFDGCIPFIPIRSGTIIAENLSRGKYFQAAIKFVTPVLGASERLNYLGLEEATTISGLEGNTYNKLFVKTNVGVSTNGSYANIITFYYE